MLPGSHRLHRSADFGAVVRRGARKGKRTVVAHVLVDTSPVRTGGPRFGLVVSKAVGDAVTRHRVSRRLRHICADVLCCDAPAEDLLVVLRALAPASAAELSELRADVRDAIRGAERRARDGAS